jgi:hypothetical protein
MLYRLGEFAARESSACEERIAFKWQNSLYGIAMPNVIEKDTKFQAPGSAD